MKPVLAISIGDIGGIGPEIVFRAFHNTPLFEEAVPVVFAPYQYISERMREYGCEAPVVRIDSVNDIKPEAVNVVPVSEPPERYQPGQPSSVGGTICLEAIEQATRWCIDGRAAALVTAPISKESLGLSGSPYRGHTEYIRDLTGAKDVLMMLVSQTMRVGLVTIHIPITEVAKAVTTEKVRRTIDLCYETLAVDFGLKNPRLAVLGLNPHAGDGGYLGTEENDIIRPAVDGACADGLDVTGPFAADGFFSAYGDTVYDAIVAMYHDQGLIPLKMSAQGRAVNISCGLPIVRTSPDHGTAFDIAGRNIANPESFIEAVRMALHIVQNRNEYRKAQSV